MEYLIHFIILLAFTWLGYETDWMRVRLPCGKLPNWPEILQQRAEANMPIPKDPYPVSHYTALMTCFPLTSRYCARAYRATKHFEPTIDISCNGKSLSVNGEYKRGMIKEFVKANRR